VVKKQNVNYLKLTIHTVQIKFSQHLLLTLISLAMNVYATTD